MADEDTITMSLKELRRLHLIQQVLEREITQGHAAEVLALSDRQLRRILARVRAEGERGLIHRARGRPSPRRLPAPLKARVLRLYQAKYAGFGPTLASEKLAEVERIGLSAETVRLWLRAAGLPYRTRRARPHRQWRERKPCVGEMVQVDGSHHAWLEDRGPACVLMAYTDDATGRVFARFYPYEGTVPALDSVRRYVQRYGLPLSLYLDKHTTYRSPGQPSLEEELAGRRPMSQFERAMRELGVEVIHAHSPQAKGRVERLFRTLQDRLVKELRLAGIRTLEAANRFLEKYLPVYTQRFAVAPASAADLHRPPPAVSALDRILCLKTERALRHDFTVAHHGRLYQIQENIRARTVTVEERLDGALWITHQGRRLHSQEIATRPTPVREAPQVSVRRQPKPAPDHPWRRLLLPHREEAAAVP